MMTTVMITTIAYSHKARAPTHRSSYRFTIINNIYSEKIHKR